MWIIDILINMDTTIQAALISVIGVLCGTLAGSILGRKSSKEAIEASNKNAIDIINRQEFNRAATEFRESFAEAQRLLAKHYTFEVAIDKEKPSVFSILDERFVDHERSMFRFRHYLSEDVKLGFDAAWETYCCKDDWDILLLCYSQKGGNDPETEKEFMKRANIHLNILLEYAKPLQG